MTKLFPSFKARTIACFATVVLVFVFAPVLFSSLPAPYWFHDHFFNTLQIATNFRTEGFPTFDRQTPTNDFSLLWGLTLSGLSVLFSTKTTLFFILVRLLAGLALCLTLWLFNRLIDALDYHPEKEARFLTSAFLTALFFYMAARSGSDTVLAIPCIFLNALCVLNALQKPSFKSGVTVGLTISLRAFARFDSAVFFLVAILVLYFQFNNTYPVSKKHLLILTGGTIVGLIPLMIYADFLQTEFGSPVPSELLSWKAVQDVAPWRIITVLFIEPIRYLLKAPQSVALFLFPSLLLPLVAYVSFPWQEEEQKPQDTVFYALIWFPIVSVAFIALATYITLPEYAFYSFAVGAPFALLFAVQKIKSQISEHEQEKANRIWLFLGGLFLIVSLGLSVKPRSPAYKPVIDAVVEFSDRNPGRYAIGAGAGFLSFSTKSNVFRIDGMAENLLLSTMLKAQEALDAAFRIYIVDYYVAVNPSKGEKCYSAREPVQNRFGGTNKGMSDWLCADPVFEKRISPETNVAVFAINPSGKAF